MENAHVLRSDSWLSEAATRIMPNSDQRTGWSGRGLRPRPVTRGCVSPDKDAPWGNPESRIALSEFFHKHPHLGAPA